MTDYTVHEVNCETGEAVTRPATPEEATALDAAQQEAADLAAAAAAAEGQRQQDMAVVEAQAATDPAFAALARLLSAQ